MIEWHSVIAAALIFLVMVLALVAVLLIAKSRLVKSGDVTISINNGQKALIAKSGKSLLMTLNDAGVHLSSACGGKGLADNAVARSTMAGARCCQPKQCISQEKRSRTTGVSDAR